MMKYPKNIEKLAKKREQARLDKDYKKSDELRKQVRKLGYEIEDTPSGPKIKAVIN